MTVMIAIKKTAKECSNVSDIILHQQGIEYIEFILPMIIHIIVK